MVGCHDFLTSDLSFDRRENSLFLLIDELGWIERILGNVFNQLQRQLQFCFCRRGQLYFEIS